MATALVTALGLDQPDLKKVNLAVLEQGSADSSFVLSTFMWEWLVGRPSRLSRESGCAVPQIGSPDYAVCLVTAHHSLAHYRSIGMKLGYNLGALQQKGVVEMHDISNMISNSLHLSVTNSCSTLDDKCILSLRDLYMTIRKSVEKLFQKSKSVCLVFGHISDLLTIGVSIGELVVFINYLQGLVLEFSGLSLVVSTHVVTLDQDSCMLAASLRHASNLTLSVTGLQTGLSKDVSGIMRVVQSNGSQTVHHYRLMERQIKVFAPGTSGL